MGRITNCFERLKEVGRQALIPYVTAGDPAPAVTVPLMHAMVAAGADIIELGVPFSDPMADGPVIQRAAERALKQGTSLRDVLAMVAEFRRQDSATPVVLMGYLNPLEVMGYGTFAKAAAEAGVDGVISVDLPPEEAHDLLAALGGQGIDPIFLLAPTTDDLRIEKICAVASGYVYYVALKGVTGAGGLDVQSVADRRARIARYTGLPVAVGFGIKDADSAAAVAKVADAVVVGSALVKKIEQNVGQSDRITREIADVLARMRVAMDTNKDRSSS